MCVKLTYMIIKKKKSPPLLALRAFESAGRLGTMTAAANELYVTPGAISRQVRQLEQYLNVELFTGSKNKPMLTTQGRELLTTLSPAMDDIYQAVEAVQSDKEKIVSVSCLNTFSIRWLIPRLATFNKLYPEIDVQLNTRTSNKVRKDRGCKNNYDIVIEVCQKEELDPNAVVLFSELLGPVISPIISTITEIKEPQDLCHLTHLRANTRPDAWFSWCEKTSNYALVFKTESHFEHYYFSLEAARSGLGVCITPQHLVIDDINANKLIAPFSFTLSGLLYTAQVKLNANDSTNHFITWLLEETKQLNEYL